ncbi:MAG TPA: hypothetical protein VIH81_01220 [Roseiarcus sp.]
MTFRGKHQPDSRLAPHGVVVKQALPYVRFVAAAARSVERP